MVLNHKIQSSSSSKPYLKSYETKLYPKGSVIYTKGEKINYVF